MYHHIMFDKKVHLVMKIWNDSAVLTEMRNHRFRVWPKVTKLIGKKAIWFNHKIELSQKYFKRKRRCAQKKNFNIFKILASIHNSCHFWKTIEVCHDKFLKNCTFLCSLQDFCPVVLHSTGQKSLQYLVHILGESMTS